MFNMNDADFIKVWEVLRKNKFRFAFLFGSLMWGMPSNVFGLIFYNILWDDIPLTMSRLVIGVITFMITGYIFGVLLYNGNEGRYNGLVSQDSP
jgi:hypothetical protein